MLNKICYKVIQSQVISVSSCEHDWSAHGHIHTKICNRLDPATTDWDNEDVEVLHCLLVASGWTGPGQRRQGA